MQLTNRQHIDYFKMFKILDLKKIQKHGQVKLLYDKIFGRKVLSVQGNVSTQNYITFRSADITKQNNTLSFSQRYLYLIGWVQPGKNFCFQLVLQLNCKVYKFIYSTIYKTEKLTSQGLVQMPLVMKSGQWTVLVVDLHELGQKHCKLQQIRLSFKLISVQIRAQSHIKNIYLTDNLYGPNLLPKYMQLPLKTGQDFYMKFGYALLASPNTTQANKQILLNKQALKNKNIQPKETQGNPQQEKQVRKNKNKYQHSKNDSIQAFKINERKTIKYSQKIDPKKPNKIAKGQINSNVSFEQVHQEIPISNHMPKPKTTINLKLDAVQGKTLSISGVTALQAFITYPTIFAVHKQIKCLSLHKQNPFKLVTGYSDGSICIWDLIRQKSLLYLKTQLNQLKQIVLTGQGENDKLFVIGNDKMKRETILILNRQQVLFKQISNYSIHGFIVCNGFAEHQQMIVSYGFQNIRLWKLNSKNHIITGVGLYLGKMNRKVTYNSACLLDDKTVLVVDSSGYITKISLQSQKMQEMKKISENGLDLILNISQLDSILIAETSGTIKLLSASDLKVVQQFQLGNRIKNLSYQYKEGEITLHIDHYNKSLSTFNMNKSQYKYLSRQHIQQVTHLCFSYSLNKLVSLSKDNTIRIWALISPSGNKNKNKLEYEIKQQYQFLISNGQSMTSLEIDSSRFAYVGFDDAIVRKIDLNKYEIVEQKGFVFRNENESQFIITKMQVSKNNKNLVLCIQEQNIKKQSINNYVVLCDNLLSIVYKYNSPPQCQKGYPNLKVLAGFSQTHKKLYICWTYGSVNKLQIYSLTEDVGKVCAQFYLQSTPSQIRFIDESIHVDGISTNDRRSSYVYEIYNQLNGQLTQALRSNENTHKIYYPFLVQNNNKQQIQVQIMHMSTKQAIDMPENVSNILIYPFSDKNEGRDKSGLIFSTGTQSNAIYAVQYQIRNIQPFENQTNYAEKQQRRTLQKVKKQDKNYMGVKQLNQDEFNFQQQQLQCVESKLIHFHDNQQNIQKKVKGNQKHFSKTISKMSQVIPQQASFAEYSQQLQGLYKTQQQLYDQCKQYIHNGLLSNTKQNEDIYNLQKYIQSQTNNQQSGVQIIYGWHHRYSYSQNTPSELIWHPDNQSALFLIQRSLILHFFKQPIHQKIVRLPAHPNMILPLRNKYIGVVLGNHIKIYSKTLQYIKTFTSIGQKVNSACLSNCQGYLIILSSSSQARKTYIQVSDIMTTSTLCSTYSEQLSVTARVVANPYQQCMEFIVYTYNNVYFYRVSSIITLQTQQLQNLQNILNNTDVGSIMCAKYLKLQEEQLILLGMQDGSVIVVDSRANSVLILCKKLGNYTIIDILYQIQSQESSQPNPTIILITQSNSIIKYTLKDSSLNQLIYAFDNKPFNILNTDSQITLHSNVKKLSQGCLGILAMTKFGVLWLIDITGNDTIKILSVHNSNNSLYNGQQKYNTFKISKAFVLSDNKSGRKIKIITGSTDGSVKQTSLWNLEQTMQIYKPRRSVYDVILANGMLIVAFNMQVFFYIANNSQTKTDKQQWKFFGSCNFLQSHLPTQKNSKVYKYKESLKIVSIKNIPYSDNYIVCTTQKLFILYHQKILSLQTNKLKLQIKQICGNFDKAEGLDLLGYNNILVRQNKKVTVWVRKEKRGQNTIQQLSKVQQLIYYMMDVYQVNAKDAQFIHSHKGVEQKQYIVCLANRPILQWRDFQTHSVIRQLQIGVSNPRVLKIRNTGTILLGDQEGTLWHVKQNGLTLNKYKVFDRPIEGIDQYANDKLIIYGQSLALVNI